jgi:hypothetical protein
MWFTRKSPAEVYFRLGMCVVVIGFAVSQEAARSERSAPIPAAGVKQVEVVHVGDAPALKTPSPLLVGGLAGSLVLIFGALGALRLTR